MVYIHSVAGVVHLASSIICIVRIGSKILTACVEICIIPFDMFVFLVFGRDLSWHVGFLDHPIKDIVVLVATAIKQIFEKLAEITDIWFFFEL